MSVVYTDYPKSLDAASAMPTKLPGITPGRNTRRQQIPGAMRNGIEKGTFSQSLKISFGQVALLLSCFTGILLSK